MGSYKVNFTSSADEDLIYWNKIGDKSILKKIDKFFTELKEHPTTGTGRPELLKGNLAGCWSRRLNRKHRIIYEINDRTVTVVVITLRGHYGDT